MKGGLACAWRSGGGICCDLEGGVGWRGEGGTLMVRGSWSPHINPSKSLLSAKPLKPMPLRHLLTFPLDELLASCCFTIWQSFVCLVLAGRL